MKFVFINYKLGRRLRGSRLIEFTLLQLLQHNVQLGAAIKFSLLSSHWFIYGVRQNFAIISLFKTVALYRVFLHVVRGSTLGRRKLLFVNERRYTSLIVSDLAVSIGETYVMGRWIGGSLTNFKRLWLMYNELLRFPPENKLSRFRLNLKRSLRGLYLLKSFPGLVFFNSVRNSYWGTGESYAMFVPSGGVTDTDAYPHSIMFPFPGNDDAFGSLYFLNLLIAKVVLISKMYVLVKTYSEFCKNLEKWRRKLAALKRRKRKYGARFLKKKR